MYTGVYRFGFSGKELESDIAEGDYDFGARIYDSRLGRWMSRDPLEAKYPNLSCYNFGANSPLFYVDPDGKVLQFYGDAKEFRKVEALINNKFGATGVKFEIGADGKAKLSGDVTKLNDQQLALYNALNTVVTSPKPTNIYALKPSERQAALGGSFSGNTDATTGEIQSVTNSEGEKKNVQYLDVYDAEAMDQNKDDAISGVGIVIHEIVEAYMYQDQGKLKYKDCHNAALVIQGNVDGYTNVTNTTPPSPFPLRSDAMTVTATNHEGHTSQFVIPFVNGDFTGESKLAIKCPILITPPDKTNTSNEKKQL